MEFSMEINCKNNSCKIVDKKCYNDDCKSIYYNFESKNSSFPYMFIVLLVLYIIIRN